MDTLKWFFFESTLALGGCLAVVLFVLLVYWRRTLRPRPLLIGLAVGAVLLAVQALVVTQREHAVRIMDGVERDVVASQPHNLGRYLSDHFRIEETGWDKQRFLDRVREYMTRVEIRTLTRQRLEVEESSADRFQISVSYLASISTRDIAAPVLSRWLIVFVREGGPWRIQTIVPVALDRRPVSGWKGIPRP